MKKIKKEYAPIANKMEYKFPESKIDFIICKSHSNTDNLVKLIYCRKCKHIHTIKRSNSRHSHGNYSLFGANIGFKCPKCGHYGTIIAEQYIDVPYKAIIFYMEDGSKAISLIVKREYLYGSDKGIFFHKTFMRGRLIYSSNGRTYFKSYVYIKNNRKATGGVNSFYGIRDITHAQNLDILSNITFQMLNKLESVGIYDPAESLKHRYPNLSKDYIHVMGELQNILSYRLTRNCFKDYKEEKRFLYGFKKSFTDLDVYNRIKKRINANFSGKKFKKLMYKYPISAWLNCVLFEKYGMKDLNCLYRMIESDTLISYSNAMFAEDFVKFIKKYISVCGEVAIVNALSDKSKIIALLDAYIYYDSLRSCKESTVNKLFHNSIKKTHDDMQEYYHKYVNAKNRIIDLKDIIEKDKRLKNSSLSDFEEEYAKRYIMEKLEKLRNNKITYSKSETKLEAKINDIMFYLPPDTNHLLEAGKHLHNCVGNCYRINALHHECTIVLMKKNDKLVGCIEVNDGKIRQALGPCNASLKDDALSAFLSWEKKNGFKNANMNSALCSKSLKWNYNYDEYDDWVKEARGLLKESEQILKDSEDQSKRYNYTVTSPF